MKICHIAPNAPYNDYWGYQDNLLPKYQSKLGHEVTMIVTNLTHKDGKVVETTCSDYRLSDGVRVIRLARKKYRSSIVTELRAKFDVYPHLVAIKPDFIFYHGVSSVPIFDAIKYKKRFNPDCVIVQDNHLDYNIGWKTDSLKKVIKNLYYRFLNMRSIKYVERVYGVTPWRKTYAEEYFGIPESKTDVLIMGADDEKINLSNKQQIREEIREKYGVQRKDFLVVTGGKIDKKKKIDQLMAACSRMSGVKLLVFGQINADVKETVEHLLQKSNNIIYIGWIDADKVYDYFFAADLVVFPGQHSVLWEQACACKVPCVFEKWDGMDHVNNGGNSDFVSPINEETLFQKIEELRFTEKYDQMKSIAESSATDVYLYSRIAEKSLECANKA